MDIDNIIKHTIMLEGGYTNDSQDAGGETKFGISKRSYPTVDIANLTIEEATEIYKRDFWDKPGISLLTNEKVAQKVFDMGVNMGASVPIRFLQQIVKVKEDGILGNDTASLVNAGNSDLIVDELRKRQLLRYADIITKKPEQIKFFKGWINRTFA